MTEQKETYKELRKFKEDFECNIEICLKREEKLEKLLENTEKDRIRLLKENQELTKKIDRQNVIEKYIQEEARKLNLKETKRNKNKWKYIKKKSKWSYKGR